MSNYNVGQVIIHEGRRCKITELTDHTAKLVNLSLPVLMTGRL